MNLPTGRLQVRFHQRTSWSDQHLDYSAEAGSSCPPNSRFLHPFAYGGRYICAFDFANIFEGLTTGTAGTATTTATRSISPATSSAASRPLRLRTAWRDCSNRRSIACQALPARLGSPPLGYPGQPRQACSSDPVRLRRGGAPRTRSKTGHGRLACGDNQTTLADSPQSRGCSSEPAHAWRCR